MYALPLTKHSFAGQVTPRSLNVISNVISNVIPADVDSGNGPFKYLISNQPQTKKEFRMIVIPAQA
ncbi:MAG: hypothetical protein ABI476_00675, partial [Oxalobacteraceae bacterium]